MHLELKPKYGIESKSTIQYVIAIRNAFEVNPEIKWWANPMREGFYVLYAKVLYM